MSRRHEQGQDLIEHALVLPLFLLFTLGIIEFGYLYLQYNTITNAAREGARAGVIPLTCDLACVEGIALDFTTIAGIDPDVVEITASNPTAGQVQVVIVYETSLITAPLIRAVGGDGAITLQTSATMNRE